MPPLHTLVCIEARQRRRKESIRHEQTYVNDYIGRVIRPVGHILNYRLHLRLTCNTLSAY